MTKDPASVAAAYFDPWRTGDLAALGSLLADSVDVLRPSAVPAMPQRIAKSWHTITQITTDLMSTSASLTGATC